MDDSINHKNKEYYLKHRERYLELAKQRYRANPDYKKIYNKQYYQNNKEYCDEYVRKIREKNKEKVDCECGCSVSKNGLWQHKKSMKHIKFVNSS